MIKKIIIALLLVSSISSYTQEISVNQTNSFELFTKSLTNSKDLKYQEILDKYDNYIGDNPNNILVKVYRCKFIGSAYYDEYEDYNLNYDETESCIEELYNSHPKNPEVALYKLENSYGEELGVFLEEVFDLYNFDKLTWNNNQVSKLFEISANHFFEKNNFKALQHAKKAEKFNDSLDLSITISKIHIELGNDEKAKESLISSLHFDNETWKLNQKAELLVDLKEYDEALKVFDRVKEKDSSFINNQTLYKIFREEDKIEIARGYLVKDTLVEWNKTANIQKLLEHDMQYSDPEIALESYRQIQKDNYYDDFFGIKRLRIFFKSPLALWTFSEISHLILLYLFVLFLFLVPYIWVLPVYALGKYLTLKNLKKNARISVDWTLKHFWGISFLYLLSQVIIVLVFYYQDYIDYFFNSDVYYSEGIAESDSANAFSTLIYFILLFISTLIFLNRERIKFVLNTNIRYSRSITLGILFLIFNAVLLKILGSFIDLSEPAYIIKFLSIKEDLKILLNEYGFVVSAILIAGIVPFYEEIIFRGIILSSTEKYLGFKTANGIQAFLFAMVHFNLELFIFYFIFGLILGYTVERTKGLLTGIILHVINNFFVLLALYYVSKLVIN